MDPLPTRLEEFRSKEYWDSFFRKLDKKPFEWYGEWPELRDLIMTSCTPERDILVAGCGNSELSALVYDAGCTRVTNIDFSKVCIVEMLKKNVRARPKMRWLVMDMTKMQFPDGSFDVVLDKGGLDALTGEPGDEGASAGAAFLEEVKRVLRPGLGRYLCVTLAQEHVIDLLLTTLGPGWHVTIHQVPLPAAGSDSPFRTYFLDVRNMATSPNAGRQLYPVTLTIDKRNLKQKPVSSGKNDEKANIVEARESQLRDLLAAVARHDARCSRQHDTCQPLEPSAENFDAYHPGRKTVCFLGLDDPAANPTQSRARFTATVLDAPEPDGNESARAGGGRGGPPRAAAQSHRCAVFLVPQGREHEWLFASEEGQWQLVEQASADRLILVTLNRGHSFGSSAEVQSELSPLVEGLAPVTCRGERRVIPYLTTNDGIGKRTVLDEAESAITGPIVVEDVELDSASGGVFRRLVFTRNQNLVQSESALTAPATSPATSSKSDSSEGRKKKGGTKAVERRSVVTSQKEQRAVDHSLLTSEYHAAMVAGLSLAMPLLEKYDERGEMARVLVIGLGGGALPMFLHNHLPLHVKVVELDPVVAQMAQRHFGFVEDERMQLCIGDGLKAVHDVAASSAAANQTTTRGTDEVTSSSGQPEFDERPSEGASRVESQSEKSETGDRNGASVAAHVEAPRGERLDVMFVDVDAGDASLPMSCPAPAFLERDFLLACCSALSDGGMLVVNVVSRASAPYAAACAMLKEVFHDVYEFDVDGDVNRVLFALHRSRAGQRSLADSTAQLLRTAKKHAPWGRGPELASLAEGIKKLS